MAINVTSSLVDNRALLMCSVEASCSTAESLHRNIEAFRKWCMVASALVGIFGVCSVAGRVGRERFLKGLLWSCILFLIKAIARNAAIKHLHKPKALKSKHHAKQILFRCHYFFNNRLWVEFVWNKLMRVATKLQQRVHTNACRSLVGIALAFAAEAWGYWQLGYAGLGKSKQVSVSLGKSMQV